MSEKLSIATAAGRHSVVWKNRKVTWEQMVKKCSETTRTAETVAEYRRMDKNRQSEVKDVGGFVGGFLREGRRKKGHVELRSMATLDIDYGTQDVWDDFQMLYSCSAMVYSTHKHTPEAPRLRLVIPFSRSVSAEEYEPVCRKIADSLGIEMFDSTTYDPTRLMYWPSTSKDGEYVFLHQEGEFLDPDEVLGTYHDWRDSSEWPVSEREGEAVRREMKKAENPEEKKGVIGAFCRTYDIEDAIETFLSSVYEPTGQEGRYTYREGSVAGGLVCYDGRFAYSHHDTDPASRQLLNAFDLVRIHLFGHLDEGSRQEDVTRLKSYGKMMEFAASDGRTKLTLIEEKNRSVEEDFAGVDATDELAEDEGKSWKTELQVTKSGAVESSMTNMVLIMENDPELKGRLRYDEFNMCVNVYGGLPWRKEAERWRDSDNAGLRYWFEEKYDISGKEKIRDAKVVCADRHRFHPVRDYLSTLRWDGRRRVASLLHDCLGAEDCPLNSRVLELWMAAAVSRVMHPGCKFDYCLILTGPQGIGKSTLLEVLGGKWFNGNISAMGTDKNALEQLAGSWIVELQELDSFKRSESSAIKTFITNVNDRYRGAYKEDQEDHPRQCVFAGTTNEAVFLKDETGDRRFWVVPVEGQSGRGRDWLIENRDQLWAEAVELYRKLPKGMDGRPAAMLDREMEEAMNRRREEVSFASENPLSSQLEDFLETKLPDDWSLYTIQERRRYFQDEEAVLTKGRNEREKMCPAEFVVEYLRIDSTDKGYQYEAARVRGAMEKMEGWDNIGRQRYWYGRAYVKPRNVYERCEKGGHKEDVL